MTQGIKMGQLFIDTLEEIKGMNANELMKKYHLVIYSKDDINTLNNALDEINKILNKYQKAMEN